jgi:uncharacterized membrane protein (UPF0127 family)/pimeloyl-ACP methyl ester carboxylesterase
MHGCTKIYYKRNQKMQRKIGRFLFVAVIAYVGMIGMVYLIQRSMQYFPSLTTLSPADTKVPEMTPQVLTTADGLAVTSWIWLPEDAKQVVVIFHGNALDLAARDFKARPLIDAGYGVVLVGYRGYSGNPGALSEEGLLNDARAVVKYLSVDRKISIGDLIFYGESLGSGVAVLMAGENPQIKGLILEAPFDSALSVAEWRFPFIPFLNILMHDQFRSDEWIGKLKMPKFILLAGQDRTVPMRFGQHLFDLAAAPKESKIYPNSGHDDLYSHGASADILAFLARLESGYVAPVAAVEPIEIKSAGRVRARFLVELAIRDHELERGLMDRTQMADDSGMLFILPSTTIAKFWMRDTLIPLDMIFIDQDGRIVGIHENAQPKDTTTISSRFPVRAVLEVPAGQVAAKGVTVGDLVLSATLDRIVAETAAKGADDEIVDPE